MAWVNPLDRLPQIPVDWANHIAQGGIAGVALFMGSKLVGYPLTHLHVTLAILAVSSAKKAVDYVKEGESIQVCVGKAVVTALWPAASLLG